VLVELGLVEQRYEAVQDVLNGATATDVALRLGVSRQTIQNWLRRYRAGGLGALADQHKRPRGCPHQMPKPVEERLLSLRFAHPRWGPLNIRHALEREGIVPVPSRSSIYRALVRNGLVEPVSRRRQRADYRRWERGRPMELWQLDVMGFRLADGTKVSLVTGIDDHSRFCVIAAAVPRATAVAVCDAFAQALRTHGLPDEVLTDNGKVFTSRFSRGTHPSEVLFERICRENGIRRLLTAPYSPTTTGKVERFHRTLRLELLAETSFDTIAVAQAGIDDYVRHYNSERPHQAIAMATPAQRFCFDEAARAEPTPPIITRTELEVPAEVDAIRRRPRRSRSEAPGVRKVNSVGVVRFNRQRYSASKRLTGKFVTVDATDTEVIIFYLGHELRRWPRKFDPVEAVEVDDVG